MLDQDPGPAEILLVIDHNPELAARARRQLPAVRVLESDGTPGLSGARNTGLRAATQPITVFLDDDAEARPGWLASLIAPYDCADVVATGGSVHPLWPGDQPKWLPPAFYWVVGCTYSGMPDSAGPVRNPIGANMSLRTGPALEAGGFNGSLGRVGRGSQGCEETELAIRLTARRPGRLVFHVPDAAVGHHVSRDRLKSGYFLSRCWNEGLSKATVVRLAGSSAGLGRERRHAATVLPATILRDLRSCATGDAWAFLRIGATISGFAAAATGYSAGRVRSVLGRP